MALLGAGENRERLKDLALDEAIRRLRDFELDGHLHDVFYECSAVKLTRLTTDWVGFFGGAMARFRSASGKSPKKSSKEKGEAPATSGRPPIRRYSETLLSATFLVWSVL